MSSSLVGVPGRGSCVDDSFFRRLEFLADVAAAAAPAEPAEPAEPVAAAGAATDCSSGGSPPLVLSYRDSSFGASFRGRQRRRPGILSAPPEVALPMPSLLGKRSRGEYDDSPSSVGSDETREIVKVARTDGFSRCKEKVERIFEESISPESIHSRYQCMSIKPSSDLSLDATDKVIFKSPSLVTYTEADKEYIKADAKAEAQMFEFLQEHKVPHLAHYYGSKEYEDGRTSFAQEYVGPSLLSQYLSSSSTEDLSYEDIKRILKQSLEFFAKLEELGIFYGDLKPGNMSYNKVTGQVYFFDFGLTSFIDPSKDMIRTLRVKEMYTLPYRDPRLLEKGSSFTPANEIWALRALMYELFTKDQYSTHISTNSQIDIHIGNIRDRETKRWRITSLSREKVFTKFEREIVKSLDREFDIDVTDKDEVLGVLDLAGRMKDGARAIDLLAHSFFARVA
jgi:serine/threonine protein kinase